MQQFIGFNVNSSEYMIPILKIREIINMPPITALPYLPSYVKGISNLRGNIIPIVYLKNLLDPCSPEGSGNTVIVLATGKIIFGIIVDGITGVIKVDESEIEPPENFFNKNADNIEGVAKLNDKLMILLDTRKLLPVDDISLLEDAIVDIKESDDGNNIEVTREIETIGGKVSVTELHDAKEYFNSTLPEDNPKHKVYQLMINIMDAIAAKEYQNVEGIVDQLARETDSDLFKEVGKITRKLHDSLEEFKGSIDNGLQKLTKDDVPNAIDKLEFVITKTEDAANRTMGIVERYFEESDSFSEHIENLKENDESAGYFRALKNSLDADMTSILTAQQFQDITGQTIKKVIDLVNGVEVELLRLVSTFGIHIKPGAVKDGDTAGSDQDVIAEGGEKAAEKVTQSDVEALLNDCGF